MVPICRRIEESSIVSSTDRACGVVGNSTRSGTCRKIFEFIFMAAGLTIPVDSLGMASGFRCSLDWNHLKREHAPSGIGGCRAVAIRINNTHRQALLSPHIGQMKTGAGFCHTSLLAKNSQKHYSI